MLYDNRICVYYFDHQLAKLIYVFYFTHQVLLHENVSQDHLLEAKLSYIRTQKRRANNLLDLHRKSFLQQQVTRQTQRIQQHQVLQQLQAEGEGHDLLEQQGQRSETRPRTSYQLLSRNSNSASSAPFRSGISHSGTLSKPHSVRATTHAVTDDSVSKSAHGISTHTVTDDNVSKSAHGIPRRTRVFTTYRHSAWPARHTERTSGECRSGDMTALRTPGDCCRDPRFTKFRASLADYDSPTDGYVQLSQSGDVVVQRYGSPSYDQVALRRRIQEYGVKLPGHRREKSGKTSYSDNDSLYSAGSSNSSGGGAGSSNSSYGVISRGRFRKTQFSDVTDSDSMHSAGASTCSSSNVSY